MSSSSSSSSIVLYYVFMPVFAQCCYHQPQSCPHTEIMRMREMAHANSSRPSLDDLKRSREMRLKELEMERIIKDCLVYLFFILVLYFISYQDKDQRSFLFSQGIQSRFLEGNPSFDSVRHVMLLTVLSSTTNTREFLNFTILLYCRLHFDFPLNFSIEMECWLRQHWTIFAETFVCSYRTPRNIMLHIIFFQFFFFFSHPFFSSLFFIFN